MSLFENCYEELKNKTANLDITPQTIIKVLQFSMEIVEASEAKGEEQKNLVEKLVKQVVVDAPISDFKEKLLLDMIEEGILGDMASLVVSATKGELNINAMAEVAGVCCKSCFGNVLKK
jgi:hypothetical protein|tara:strand:- start:1182 stop:1538 length:357 start_codon:yes stop_codon:yes gene_type:complete